MDPYLETDDIWPAFHHQLIASLYQILLPNLVDRYKARVSQRHYITEQALFTSIVREEHHEELVEIRQRGENRLVSMVEVVSPANKTTGGGRDAYLNKRREARSLGANLIEIDLVLQGQAMLDYARDGLPEWDYAVTVTRAKQPDRYEIYTATLDKRLPRFRLPLAGEDRDTVVDLQAALSRCFEQGGFGERIDYRRDPITTLNGDQRRWIDTLLKQQKHR
jgi:hypothetical protein